MTQQPDPDAALAVPERLRRAAARLFAANGFDATTVEQVTVEAGVTKGAFYYYYEAKSDLLYEMHRRVSAHQLNRAGQILAEDEDDLSQALRRLVVELVESIALYRDEVTIVLRESRRFPADVMPRVREDRRRLHDLLEGVLRAGQERGLVRWDVTAGVLASSVLGMCTSTHERQPLDGAPAPAELGEGLAAVCLGGVLLADPRPSDSEAPS